MIRGGIGILLGSISTDYYIHTVHTDYFKTV